MEIRIAGTEVSIQRGSYEIFVQGCYRNCKGCHNPETHMFDGGYLVNVEEFLDDIWTKVQRYDGLITDIYISGGDLLCQPEETAIRFTRLVRNKFPHIKLWLYTGCKRENLPEWVWDYYDVVKAGEYIEELRLPDGSFPASSNQEIIDNPFRMKG